MNAEFIFKGTLSIVGTVQLLKQFIPCKKGWVWTIITILVGSGICLIQSRFPRVAEPIVTVTGATIFYDTIYQSFEKIFKREK